MKGAKLLRGMRDKSARYRRRFLKNHRSGKRPKCGVIAGAPGQVAVGFLKTEPRQPLKFLAVISPNNATRRLRPKDQTFGYFLWQLHLALATSRRAIRDTKMIYWNEPSNSLFPPHIQSRRSLTSFRRFPDSNSVSSIYRRRTTIKERE